MVLALNSPALGEVADIQRQLFELSQSTNSQGKLAPCHIDQLEQWIDGKLSLLPTQQGAILPGGDKTAAHARVCRAICRRAERAAVALHKQHPQAPVALAYLNRLSDYFLVLARRINQRQGVCDNSLVLDSVKDQD
ncbi:ATP:cob(I)alamin adenosyltransferase [Thalassotalea litorea]|uniref:ATP:cob(I)alamin adenosyltransferase n=1 Tax=Thalassotalea litorea TaxID=2020715 RepID=UPI0037364568